MKKNCNIINMKQSQEDVNKENNSDQILVVEVGKRQRLVMLSLSFPVVLNFPKEFQELKTR